MSDSDASCRGETSHLLRVLTFTDLLVYGLVYVSPIGPWATWAFTSSLTGGAVALTYLLGAAALSFTALSYAKMAVEVPEAGSVYSYARHALGEGAGFVAGWMVLLDYLLLPGLNYVFCGATLAQFLPVLPAWGWILVVAAYNMGINWFGIRTNARFNMATLLMQFAMLFTFLLLGIYAMKSHRMAMFTADPWWGAMTTPASLFSAASLCVNAYLGFDAITTLSSEVRPEQLGLIGRAVLVSLALIGGLGVIDVWVLSDLSRGLAFKDLTTATFETIGARISPDLGVAAAWGAVIAVAISITPPMVTAVSRVLYAMAEQGEMPSPLAKLHPRYGVPHVALLTSGAISIVVALYFASQYDALASMVNFGALTAFIAVNASVIALFQIKRKRGGSLGTLVSPVIGIVVLSAVLVQMRPLALGIGIGWLLAGIIVYVIIRQRRRMTR